MAKQKKKSTHKEVDKKPDIKSSVKANEDKQEPAKKIKVNRSRRRLYETPAKEKETGSTIKSTKKSEINTAGKKTKKRKSTKKKTGLSVAPKREALQTTSAANSDNEFISDSVNLKESNRIVEKYSAIASGSVLLPIPVVDLVYIMGVQLKMLSDLSKLYGIEFKRDRGKAIVTSLLSGLLSNKFMFSTAPFLIRYIPIAGYLLAPISIVVFSSALTYGVGKVFIQHFEAGGTFLNFKPDEVRTYFMDEFEKKYQVEKDDS